LKLEIVNTICRHIIAVVGEFRSHLSLQAELLRWLWDINSNIYMAASRDSTHTPA
jgi:hypothetical protein